MTEYIPKHPKPGKPKKKKQKMPKPPAERYCRKLGYVTGSERWCHAEARLIKFLDGGGIMGGRIDHKYTAWLSFEADQELSQPLSKNATKDELENHAYEWERLIKLSH